MMEGTESWMVGDLIDHESKDWLEPVIEELFTSVEVDQILRIPLSLRPMDDRLV